ncbi:MAG: transcription antitermination factor NusB [Candidatus Aminicenantales bacterium]
MGLRRKSRESALQILFEREFNDLQTERLFDEFWKNKKASEPVKEYANWLVKGTVDHQEEVDKLIQGTSKHWRLARMAIVDRNILRIAVFELLHEEQMAPAIIINEAIEIAKKYSSDKAGMFVNGILDAVRKKIGPRESSKEEKDNERKSKKK